MAFRCGKIRVKAPFIDRFIPRTLGFLRGPMRTSNMG